jgi:hypothetical protein
LKESPRVDSYWDESGIQDADVCLMAGYFGGANQWRRLNRRWNEILGREGVREFHAKEFWRLNQNRRRTGPYKDWDDERAEQFLSDLVSASVDVKIHPVCCAVSLAEWKTLTLNQQRYFTGARFHKVTHKQRGTGAPTKPYFWCFQHCVFNAAKYCDGVVIDAYFDRSDQLQGYAQGYWSELADRRMLPWRNLGAASFPNSEDAPGIQLADLLAYRVRRYAVERLQNRAAVPEALLRKLISRIRDSSDCLFITDVSKVLNEIPAYLADGVS